MPTVDWFKKWNVYSPHKVAISCSNSKTELSYQQLHFKGEALALELSENWNIQKGDRIAVLAEFTPGYFTLFAAMQKMGFILVPLNYRLAAPEITYQLEDCQPSLFLYQEKFANLAQKAAPQAVKTQALETIEEVENGGQEIYPGEAPQLEDPAFILYTSGSTGFPKGVLYTHKMMFWNSVNTALRLNITAQDHTVMVMPPFHTGGWNVLTTPFLHFGASVCLQPKFEPEETLQLLAEQRATLFMAVPTMVGMLADSTLFMHIQLPHLRYFIVGGEALPIPLIEKWAQKKVYIRQGYGLTEVGTNVTSLAAADAIRKQGSIGFPNFYIDAKLMKEDGQEAQADEIGELWLRGPVVTPGYWQNPEATAKSFSGDWFKTGDLLKQDEEGYLYVVDRIKNMFISGGENVFPAEVERHLITHPAVKEVAVVGVSDEKWGEVGKAFYAAQEPLDLADLKSFAQEGLAKFKVPKYFEHRLVLPKTDSGKINKKALT